MSEIRSDVVGSLLRPGYLKEARRQLEMGKISDAAFKRTEDQAVDEAIQLQLDAGLDVVTDGEMRRSAFFGHLIDSLEGFDKDGGKSITFRNEQGEQHQFPKAVVVDRLKRKRHMSAEEFAYLRARINPTDKVAKATLINAQMAASYYDADLSGGAYPSVEAFLADVVDLLRDEIAELIRLGCRYIQLDAPMYASLLDANMRAWHQSCGNDPDRLLDVCIEMDNAIIEGQKGASFALHLCRGNNRGKFYASGGYDPIAAKIFQETKVNRFLLEYDDDRSGGFEPLKLVPDDRTVVLGLVSTKKPALEDRDELRRRIREAERFIPSERLALSPQCGFASTWEGNEISHADQEAKLRLIADVAKEVWG